MIRLAFAVLLGLSAMTAPAKALTALPKPKGKVILTVTGAIENTNAEGRAEFDRKMLEDVGMVDLETETPWTEGSTLFRGILARDLMHYLGARGDEVEAAALGLYRINIPMDDFERFDVLIALEDDGRKLRVRDQGPTWMIYPWSQHEELGREVYSRRSVWQMTDIAVQ